MRSGKEVESSRQREESREEEKAEKEVEIEPDRPAEAVPTRCSEILVCYSEGPKSRGISFSENPPIISPQLTYPQQFQNKKLDTQFSKFLEIFKKIYINIPFVDDLEQMLNYAKFMAKKRKLQDYEIVKLIEECNAILQRKLPQKVKDPGSFTILCTIRDSNFDKVLCDLSASINLMPLQCSKN